MVLVASQSGATRESLLAVGVGALVRSLARVDAAMAGQGAGITKWLRKASMLVHMQEVL